MVVGPGVRSRVFALTFVASCCAAASLTATARAETRAVVTPETPVRSAPFEVAPEIARLRAGDRVVADDAADDAAKHGWRRVRLADGRFGFVREADTEPRPDEPPAAPPPPPASEDAVAASPPAPATPSAPSSPPPARPPAEPAAGPALLGVTLELLPVGTLDMKSPAGDRATRDAVFALGVAPFLDVAASPYLAFGLSPQVIFRVKADGDEGQSAKQFDVRGRITARLPLSPKVRAFARFSPGLSWLDLPRLTASGGAELDRPRPWGFVMGGAVGTEVAVLPNLSVVTNLGYQFGFQDSTDGEIHTSYLHVGAGFAIGF
jgi:hypothetical protein